MRGYNTNYYMPLQKTAMVNKNEEWRKQCVDAILNMSSNTMNNGRTTRQNKQVNYDLYNSKFDEEDFNYVLNPYGNYEQYGESPSKIQNYNIIRSKIELLKGEEIKRPFNFFAKGTHGGAISSREQKKTELILQSLQAMLMSELGIETEEEAMGLSDIEKYINSEFMDPREVTANQLIQYLLKQEKLEMKFNQGWEHALIVAEEVYYVGIHNGEPKLRVVNPINFDCDKDDDIQFIEDAQWAKEERWLTPGSILDLYGEVLSDKDLDRIDSGELGYGYINHGMQPGFAYEMSSFKHNFNRPQNGIMVVNVCWKSWKKIGFLRFGDEEIIVDEDYILDSELKNAGAILEWRWINEVWEGTRIGMDIYVNIRPLPNQSREMDNPSVCKLPYTGYIYNNTNSQATSILDLVKPHQYTYMIVWWRLENELAKAKGKKFLMDLAMLPKSQGWNVDQWMYYFDNMGVAFINSMEEGREGDPSSVSKFNQFTDIDMSLSQVVGQYMEVLNKIEEQVSNLTGVSPQREAQTSPSESATGVQNAIVQSSHITEPYFYYHNLVKSQVLTKLLECAKIAYSGGKKIHHIADEIYSEIINIDGETFADSDYGVFVTNSSKDFQVKEKLEALAQVALQQEKVTLSDLIKIYQSNSISEISSQVAKSEKEFYERTEASEQANRESQERVAQMNQDTEKMKIENDNMNKQLDRQNKIDVAVLGTLRGKDGATDMNGNSVPDAVEQSKIQIELSKRDFEREKANGELGVKLDKQARDDERAREKNRIEINKQNLELQKFTREQDQQDNLNKTQTAVEIHKAKLEAERLKLDAKIAAEDLKMREKEMKFKLVEMNAKLTLEKFKAQQKAKQEAEKAKADIAAKKEKTKADIAIKKQSAKVSDQAKKASIKTKSNTKPKK